MYLVCCWIYFFSSHFTHVKLFFFRSYTNVPVCDSFKDILAPTRPPTGRVEHFDGFLEIFLLALLLALALLETVDPPDAVYAPKRTISRDRLLMAKNIRTYKNVIILVGM